MKERYKAWETEDGYTLLKALELRVNALGYHVAMAGSKAVKRPELELLIYPNVTATDEEHIASLLHATELRLRKKMMLKKPKKFGNEPLRRVDVWEHGKGKNTRRVLVFYQQTKPSEESISA